MQTVNDFLGLAVREQSNVKPGAGINPFDPTAGRKENVRSVINDYKFRYVFNPLAEIPLFGRHMTGAMSINRVLRGRINFLQPCPYKHRDESDAALHTYITEWDSNELAESVNTPFAQALFLHEAYSDRGLVVLDSLTGFDPGIVTLFEEVVLPKIPSNVVALLDYIQTFSAKSLQDNTQIFPPNTLEAFKAALRDMIRGCNQAITWANNYLLAREAEIQSARIGRGGAENVDPFDAMLYVQLGRKPIEARKVAREGETEDSEDRMVRVISRALGKQSDNKLVMELFQKVNSLEAQLRGETITTTLPVSEEEDEDYIDPDSIPDLSEISIPVENTFQEAVAAREEEATENLPEDKIQATGKKRRGR
jgi:hypothetical protein